MKPDLLQEDFGFQTPLASNIRVPNSRIMASLCGFKKTNWKKMARVREIP
jgi:hypothetical protein